MPFSTSFCLTNTGSLPSNTTLSFYSNVDGYTVPFQTTVPLFSVTGNNCPYTLNGVYDNTQTIKVESSIGNCCAVVNVTPNDPCTFCNLGFDSYSSTTLSRIVAGNLTGSCDNNITDYLIEWYNINDLNTVVYTSGFGVEFQPYSFTHPLVGLSSIPALSGTYVPVIKKIKLNGIKYSSQLETGFVQASLNCFTNTTVSVSPLTCNNGTQQGNYSHLTQFSGASQGQFPVPVQSTFLLSNTTNYFAWKFDGFDIPDTMKITYYGSYYNNTPIVLEYFQIGSEVNYNQNNWSSSLFPKLTKTNLGFGGFNKVTCLTGLTRSVNDFLILEILPNQTNTKTNFNFYFKCLDTFDCVTCMDNYLNTPYKIIQSSLVFTLDNCFNLNITARISGCTDNDINNSDVGKYIISNSSLYSNSPAATNVYTYSFNETLYTGRTNCSPSGNYIVNTNTCNPNTGNIISFMKDNSGVNGTGFISMEFSNSVDFLAYYNTYLYWANQPYYNGTPNDPTNINYYRHFKLTVPIPNNPNDPCGDDTFRAEFYIHPSTIVTTGTSNTNYTLTITMPTIEIGINYPNCYNNCNGTLLYQKNLINLSSTGNTNNFNYVNNASSRVFKPFNEVSWATLNFNSLTASTYSGSYQISEFLNRTSPYSGSTPTYIPSLNAETCVINNGGTYYTQFGYNSQFWGRNLYYYYFELQNPLNPSDLYIYAKNITNGNITGDNILIYTYLNNVGTVINPNYFV